MQEPAVAPQAPTVPSVRIEAGPTTVAQTLAIPQSVEDIAGLRSRRSELIDQLDRARDRRENITEEMGDGSGPERTGLEQILAAIDQRIVQIEADIGATERALTSAPTGLLGAAELAEQARRDAREANKPMIDEDMLGIMGMIGMFMLFPIVIAHARRIWRRQPAPRALPVAVEGRLERIEQAVESIAVEVERVSEGQRFVTKLMSESKGGPVQAQGRMLPEPQRGST